MSQSIPENQQKNTENDNKQIQSLSSKDVVDVGKAAVRTAAVWTLAGFMTSAVRNIFKNIKWKN